MWRKSGYFGNFVATQFFDFGGKVAIFGGKAADFERKILATLLILWKNFFIKDFVMTLFNSKTKKMPLSFSFRRFLHFFSLVL